MNQNSFKIPAFAKINWFLRILGKREDNFHELCTAFQTISLCDFLSFSEHTELILKCNDQNIPTDEQNLIIRAAKLLQKRFGIKKGAEIYLEKNIPSPGGLGGGSADCAVALLGLLKLWGLNISRTELCEMGKSLGSDVPFFFFGGTALGIGRGAEIIEDEEVKEKFVVLVTPNISVPTPTAFAKLNAPRLTNYSSKSILKLCCNEAQSFRLQQTTPINDFEKVIFEIEPEIKRAKEKLLESGAKLALMSGSGASVFGIFENEETRQATLKAFNEEVNWRKFAVATVSREKYREALKNVLKVVSD
ncbi:MAG: 4-(cytidine 5'-diphospho)-2-C-methyl-D-erythritol kinase [Pyrinomonadaceae bacterium]|nr:4-(cytidine 5'-diphospho)-2-C-methyl-D-erythritol kinase [Pyrinomonadaceae bacterium]